MERSKGSRNQTNREKERESTRAERSDIKAAWTGDRRHMNTHIEEQRE